MLSDRETLNLTTGAISNRAALLAGCIDRTLRRLGQPRSATGEGLRCYPVPRGGVPVALALQASLPGLRIVDDPQIADFIVDDLVDSGATRDRYADRYPGVPFFALYHKEDDFQGQWVSFPWERKDGGDDASADDIVIRLLQFIGEDVSREGLTDTPKRVLKAWQEWTSGYGVDPKSVLKVFEDGAEQCDEMVIRKVPFYSHCEHHMAAIIGTAVVSYIPNHKIVGLSKIDRLVDIFARRLQVQERMTNQIAEALMDALNPKGVGVWINARHMCVESRGVRNIHSETDTLAVRGVYRDDARARSEFLAVARSKVV